MSERRKIRVLEGIRQGKIGGGESYVLSLVEHLDRNIFEPVVLSFTDGPMVDKLRSRKVPTYVIPSSRAFDISVWSKVKKLMVDEKIDVVHAHGSRAQSNMYWAARKLELPLIYTCHGWSFHLDQHPVKRKLRIWGEQFLSGKSTVNICVSHANRRTGKELFGHFDAEVIHTSIDTKKFDPNGNYKDIRKEFGISKDAILIAYVARLTVQKQPLVMIEAFARVASEIPNAMLLMVGDGEDKQQVEERVRELKLEDRIILQSFRQDVPDLLAASDLFVLPSLWEGFPIALVEAMAMGKAVVATNVDGTPEIVKHEENGLLIAVDSLKENLEEAILRLCKDEALRKHFQQQAIATTVNLFNVKTMVTQNEAIYKRLVSK